MESVCGICHADGVFGAHVLSQLLLELVKISLHNKGAPPTHVVDDRPDAARVFLKNRRVAEEWDVLLLLVIFHAKLLAPLCSTVQWTRDRVTRLRSSPLLCWPSVIYPVLTQNGRAPPLVFPAKTDHLKSTLLRNSYGGRVVAVNDVPNWGIAIGKPFDEFCHSLRGQALTTGLLVGPNVANL
jgi:hypothetical protein